MKKVVVGFVAFLLVAVNVAHVVDNVKIFLTASNEVVVANGNGDDERENIAEEESSAKKEQESEPKTEEKEKKSKEDRTSKEEKVKESKKEEKTELKKKEEEKIEKAEEKKEKKKEKQKEDKKAKTPFALVTLRGQITVEAGDVKSADQIYRGSSGLDLGVIKLGGPLDISQVNFGVPGDYEARAEGINAIGISISQIIITVHIVDQTPPQITGLETVSYSTGTVINPTQFIADASIKVMDNASAIVTPNVDLTGVNFNVAGKYTAVVNAEDASGNKADPLNISVTIGDFVGPIINGNRAITYIRGIVRNEAEFIMDTHITVTDNSGEIITPKVDLSDVLFNRIGEYTAVVTAKDSAGNEAVPFEVKVTIITIPPNLITGKSEITYEAGTEISDEQFILDANIKVLNIIGMSNTPIVSLGPVDFRTVGVYTVYATGMSLAGVPLANILINVHIVDTTPPIITGEAEISYDVGTIITSDQFFFDANIQVTDNTSTEVFPTVDLTGVNFAVDGKYQAVVHATDASGNNAQPFYVRVIIGDVIPPIITGDAEITYIRGISRSEAELITDAHIQVTDNVDETITPIVDLSAVNFNHVGNYEAIVNAQDKAKNNAIPLQIKVNILPVPENLITANTEVTYEAGQLVSQAKFIKDTNMQIMDVVGVSPIPIVNLSTLDFETIGDYIAYGTAESFAGNPLQTVPVNVKIIDTTPPIISGEKNVYYPIGIVITPEQFLLDADVQVSDNETKRVVPHVDLSGVNFNAMGIYQAIVTAKDASGNVAEPLIITVTVGDMTPPIITGDSTITYIQGITRTPAEFIADTHIVVTDDSGEQIIPVVDLGQLDFKTRGKYVVTVTAKDSANNQATPFNVDVIIEAVPVDIITAKTEVSYEAGFRVDEAQFLIDADIKIRDIIGVSPHPEIILGTVAFDTVGIYPVIAKAETLGNEPIGGVKINVNIVDTTAPIITGADSVHYSVGASITPEQFLIDANIKVTDNESIPVIPSVDLTGIKFDVDGVYEAIVHAQDSSGNDADPFIVTVTIGDVIPPVITGDTEITYIRGVERTEAEFFVDAHIHVTDDSEETIIPTVDLSGVDFKRIDTYVVNVMAKDRAGNEAIPFSVTINIVIVPSDIITAKSDITYEAGKRVEPAQVIKDANIKVLDLLGVEPEPFVSLGTVDFDKVRVYPVVARALNLNGAILGSVIVNLHIVDTTAPTITGDDKLSYPLGEVVTSEQIIADAKIQVSDNTSEKIVPAVDLTDVNFNVDGVYKAIVTAHDTSGNEATPFIINITIGDVIPPVITGDQTIEYVRGISRTESEFIADTHIQVTDNTGEMIIPTVDLSPINFARVGSYTVTVYAKDSAGNLANPWIITVVIKTVPADLLTAKLEVTYEAGEKVDLAAFIRDAEIQILDLLGVSATPVVNLKTVDFDTVGTYQVIINAMSLSGVELAKLTTNIHIIDTTPPVITGTNHLNYPRGTSVSPNQFLLDANIQVRDNSTLPVSTTVDLSSVNFALDGIYQATVRAKDASGNESNPFIVTVTIGDITPPVITGDSSITYIRGIARDESQFIADTHIIVTDDSGETIIPTVDLSHVNFTQAGTYQVTVNAKDSSGNEAEVFMVTVRIIAVPNGLITAKTEVTYEVGNHIERAQFILDANINILDILGISGDPLVSLSTVDFSSVGVYHVVASAVNLLGVPLATITINVHIVDTTPPVIIGNAEVSYEVGTVLTPEQVLSDAKINVTDNSGKSVVPSIDLSTVNWGKEGLYIALVTATDASGNVGRFELGVRIQPDITPPVMTGNEDVSYELGSMVTPEQFIKDANIIVNDNSGLPIMPEVNLSGINFRKVGIYKVTVYAKDEAGNTTSLVVNVTITPDVTAPVITGNKDVSYELGSTVSPDQVLADANINVNDNSGETIKPEIDLSGVDFNKEGKYVVPVTARDSAGNSTQFDVTITITRDVTGPVITGNTTASYELGKKPTDDEFLANAQIVVSDNSGEDIKPIADLSNVDFNKEGSYTAIVRATDTAGNTTSFEVNVIITPDVTAPIITGTPNLTYVAGTTVTPQQVLLDANISVSDNNPAPIIPSVDLSGVKFDVIGTYKVIVQAKDASGNEAIPFEITITIVSNDKTPPVITGDDKVSYYVNRPVTVEQFITDAHITVSDNSGETITPAIDLSQIDFTTPGLYIVTVNAKDSAGNEATPHNVSVTIHPAPKLEITIDHPTLTYEVYTPVDTGKIIDDANILIIYNSDLMMTSDVDMSKVNTDKLGTYPVIVTADDSYGNHETATVTVNIVDTTAPIINGLNRVQYIAGENVDLTRFLQDAEIFVNDNYDDNVTPIVDLSGVNFKVAGTYVVTIQAKDKSGNEATPFNVTITVLRNEALPVITGDNAVSYVAKSDISEDKFLADTHINVSSNSGENINPAADLSGVNFDEPGEYKAIVNARDSVGNEAEPFEVTTTIVPDVTPPVITGVAQVAYIAGSVQTPADILRDANINVADDSGRNIIATVDLSGVDFHTPGTYQVIIKAQDFSGNEAIAFLVTVVILQNNAIPVITGDSAISYVAKSQVGDDQFLADTHIQVSSGLGENIIPAVDLNGVNFDEPGEYKAIVKAKDSVGNEAEPFEVTTTIVPDVTPPVITGNEQVTYIAGIPKTPADILHDANIQVTDDSRRDIVPTVDLSGVDFMTPGRYPVNVKAQDLSGNEATPFPVTVAIMQDHAIPVITGDPAISYVAKSQISDNQFLADTHIQVSSGLGENIIPTVDLTGVNFDKPGDYKAIVKAKNSIGREADPFEVKVTITPDVTPPIITGESQVTYTEGPAKTPADILRDANINVTDDSGRDIVPSVDLSGVDFSTPGRYPVNVKAQDLSGNEAIPFPVIVVIMRDEAIPVISGDDAVSYIAKSQINDNQILADAHINVRSASGETVTPTVDLTGVNFDKPGDYKAIIRAKDSSGHEAKPFEVKVTITPDITPPVITGESELTYIAGQVKTPSDILHDANIAVSDDSGRDIVPAVDLSGVNFNKAGTYHVNVTAQDLSGNKAIPFPITITILQDATIPVITGERNVTYEAGPSVSPEQFIRDANIQVTHGVGNKIVPSVDLSNVKFKTPGTYQVVVNAQDEAGNRANPFQVTVTITPDVTPPVIIADPNVSYYLNRPVDEQQFLKDVNASVIDNSGDDIAPAADLSGVDFTKEGTYPVTITAVDNAGNVAVPLPVSVRVHPAPVLELKIEKPELTYEVGTPLTPELVGADAGVTLRYQSGLTASSTVDLSSVKSDKLGTYPVVVRAEDSYGNHETGAITVNIVDTIPPTITSTNDNIMYFIDTPITPEIILADAGIAATDAYDGDITPSVEISAVDPKTDGTYIAKITAVDKSGNEATFPVTVDIVGVDFGAQTAALSYEAGSPVDEDIIRMDSGLSATTRMEDVFDTLLDLATLNPLHVGEYTIIASVKFGDEPSQTLTLVITLSITDETPPEINVGYEEEEPLTYSLASLPTEDDIINDGQITVKDNSDDVITPKLDLSAIDINTAGQYTVAIDAEDTQGNKAETVSLPIAIAAADTGDGGRVSNTGSRGGGLPLTGETAAFYASILGVLLIIGSIIILVLNRKKANKK